MLSSHIVRVPVTGNVCDDTVRTANRMRTVPDCSSLIKDMVELIAGACQELDESGFTIVPGPVPTGGLALLAAAYDAAVDNAAPESVKVGSSTTRISDFVNRGPEFDGLYLHPPLLHACCRMIKESFRLSTMHARTLRPGLPAQDIHVDFGRDLRGWTMVGFIFMVDEFRIDNGATRFVPGSHLWSEVPSDLVGDRKANYPGQVLRARQRARC